MKILMKYLRIYQLLKWNLQNQLIFRLTCIEVTKVLWYSIIVEEFFYYHISKALCNL